MLSGRFHRSPEWSPHPLCNYIILKFNKKCLIWRISPSSSVIRVDRSGKEYNPLRWQKSVDGFFQCGTQTAMLVLKVSAVSNMHVHSVCWCKVCTAERSTTRLFHQTWRLPSSFWPIWFVFSCQLRKKLFDLLCQETPVERCCLLFLSLETVQCKEMYIYAPKSCLVTRNLKHCHFLRLSAFSPVYTRTNQYDRITFFFCKVPWLGRIFSFQFICKYFIQVAFVLRMSTTYTSFDYTSI